MPRFLKWLLPLVVLSLTSCGGFISNLGPLLPSNGTSDQTQTRTIEQILAILTSAGYADLDTNNTPEQHTYFEGVIEDNYGLSLNVTGFYQGYVNQNTRWAMIVVFGSVTAATAYFDALQNDVNVTGYILLEGNIVIQTSSAETFALIGGSVTSSSLATSTTSSSSSAQYRTEAEMIDMLFDAGYTNITVNNDSASRGMMEEDYLDKYGITVTMLVFYTGYLPGNTYWMQLEVFETIAMGLAAYESLNDDATLVGYVHYEGSIVLRTSSAATWALFN